MIFDIIEEKLKRSFLLVPGESLFRSYMPAECSIGAMSKVPLNGIAVNQYIPNFYQGKIQIITRHTDPVAGDITANKIASILKVNAPRHYPPSAERGEATISIFLPDTLPIRFPRLTGNGYEWSQMFTVAFSFEPLN